jgi:hypothetical protein
MGIDEQRGAFRNLLVNIRVADGYRAAHSRRHLAAADGGVGAFDPGGVQGRS